MASSHNAWAQTGSAEAQGQGTRSTQREGDPLPGGKGVDEIRTRKINTFADLSCAPMTQAVLMVTGT
jgi:hypothetical protein